MQREENLTGLYLYSELCLFKYCCHTTLHYCSRSRRLRHSWV